MGEREAEQTENEAKRMAKKEAARIAKEEVDKSIKYWSTIHHEKGGNSIHTVCVTQLNGDFEAIKWRCEFKAICKAQEIEFMLNGKYGPATDTVGMGMDFKYTSFYLYAVLLKTVKTSKTKPKGKSIVLSKHKDNGQKAYAEIIEHYFGLWWI